MQGFFDNYPRFYETGNTAGGARLNARYDCLIDANLDLIRDRTVLDVASHDGRWTFAALQAGARHVTAIEPRTELVAFAEESLARYGIDSSRVSFHAGDAREVLQEIGLKVDTVFLFGILYHVHYHVDLFAAARAADASTVIVDSSLMWPPPAEDAPLIRIEAERTGPISQSAVPAFPGAPRALVGVPSAGLIEFLLREFEFEPRRVDWQPYLEKWRPGDDGTSMTGLADYAEGRRVTFVGERTAV